MGNQLCTLNNDTVNGKDRSVIANPPLVPSATEKLPRVVLPANVKPTNYLVDINTNFENDFKYAGSVTVDLEVVEETNVITCNSKFIEIKAAFVKQVDKKDLIAEKIEFDLKTEQVSFYYNEKISIGGIKLYIEFTGVHADGLIGFYRKEYKVNGDSKLMLVTQFESAGCRRCFPCWDEPALKATFEVILRVPKNMTALSNMDIISEVEEDSLKIVKFNKTPIMSSYILAFAVAELHYKETITKQNVKVRMYTALSHPLDQSNFALDIAKRCLEYFTEYFDTPYPLSKLDIIGVPDKMGAMENWGLITSAVSVLLLNKETSAKNVKLIASFMCHEIAHQWFGNLVTMAWWDDLWLNEGFAVFSGEQCVHHLFPNWNTPALFTKQIVQPALNLDGLRNSHPIQVEVSDVVKVDEIFDAISYNKGAAVIKMVNSFLAEDDYKNGLRTYFKELSYKNATTNDLLRHWSNASGKNVEKFVDSWLGKMGYPVVTVKSTTYDENKKELTLCLKQKRFLSSGDLTIEEENASDATVWHIPLNILTSDGKVHNLTLDKKEGTVTFPYNKCKDSFWKLNGEAAGFYISKIDPREMKNLITVAQQKLSVLDKVNIINNVFALARSGEYELDAALDILSKFKDEEEYLVLEEITEQLKNIINICYNEPKFVQDSLENLLGQICSTEKLEKLGWTSKPDEDYLLTLKRGLLISFSARAGNQKTYRELESRFKKFMDGDEEALPGDIRDVAISQVLQKTNNPQEDFDKALKYALSRADNEKRKYLACLGSTNSIEILKYILNELVFDEKRIKSVEVLPILQGMSSYIVDGRKENEKWKWLKKNMDVIEEIKKVYTFSTLTAYVFDIAIGSSVGTRIVEEYKAFRQGVDVTGAELEKRLGYFKGGGRLFDQLEEKLQNNTRFIEKNSATLQKWAYNY
ncbi:Aminopeptidase 2 mitochondrial [Clydaea vesicula]|uniref:Aminopeptidase n=1 Tax=Clydaea vesicula TaxID=447962 RepID=A0AAD5Y3G9_9FUNG|nr:Aminopeptidase 2 mitochondrial [Clydaea vesicula]